MKKTIVLASCLIVFNSCQTSDTNSYELERSLESHESYDSVPTMSAIDQVETALQHSEYLEDDIKTTQTVKTKLQSENLKLKTELQQVKDSLDITKTELRELKVKSAPKQNFIQRVLGIQRDSIETTVTDSIIYE